MGEERAKERRGKRREQEGRGGEGSHRLRPPAKNPAGAPGQGRRQNMICGEVVTSSGRRIPGLRICKPGTLCQNPKPGFELKTQKPSFNLFNKLVRQYFSTPPPLGVEKPHPEFRLLSTEFRHAEYSPLSGGGELGLKSSTAEQYTCISV